MIDETMQDLAVAYVLGELKGAEGIRFLTVLSTDPDLQRTVREIEETLGEVALTAPRVAPPAGVAERLSKEIRSRKVIRLNYLPWGLAAAFAIAFGSFAVQRDLRRIAAITALQQRAETAETSLAALQQEAAASEKEMVALRQKLATSEGEIRRLAEAAESYRKKSDLSDMKVATLSAQVQSYASALAVVVWDAQRQEGLVKLSKLPKLQAGKDYQLWVLDPSYKQPVSAGVVSADPSGFARAVFRPTQEIHGADNFAVSIEKAGGSPAPQGQVVLVGQ